MNRSSKAFIGSFASAFAGAVCLNVDAFYAAFLFLLSGFCLLAGLALSALE